MATGGLLYINRPLRSSDTGVMARPNFTIAAPLASAAQRPSLVVHFLCILSVFMSFILCLLFLPTQGPAKAWRGLQQCLRQHILNEAVDLDNPEGNMPIPNEPVRQRVRRDPNRVHCPLLGSLYGVFGD